MTDPTPANSAFNFDDGAPNTERLREHSADFTPRGVVDQFVSSYFDLVQGVEGDEWARKEPHRVLDPAAGGGVFGQAIRAEAEKRGLLMHITAVELRGEEASNLGRHYDEVVTGDALEYAKNRRPFDWIVTNPPFPRWREYVRAFQPLLRRTAAMSFLGLVTWGQRSKAGVDLFLDFRYRPVALQRSTGTLGFRGPGTNPETGKRHGTDTRSYGWWMWGLGYEAAGWVTSNLPLLDAAGRRWKVKPGYE